MVESNIAQKSIKLHGIGLFQKFPKMPSKDLTNMVSKWNLLRMMALGMLDPYGSGNTCNTILLLIIIMKKY